MQTLQKILDWIASPRNTIQAPIVPSKIQDLRVEEMPPGRKSGKCRNEEIGNK
jgi:hypothetical protein